MLTMLWVSVVDHILLMMSLLLCCGSHCVDDLPLLCYASHCVEDVAVVVLWITLC